MKKITVLIFVALLVFFHQQVKLYVCCLIPAKWCNEALIYASIKNICSPQIRDYERLQSYLSKGKRRALSALKDYKSRARHFRLIGKRSDEHPRVGTIAVNCDENNRQNCLIVYASYNKSYPRGLKRLVDHVSASDFKGHILYRIGGWPNVEEGDLVLAHVPYAFKPCFFREAERLGYRKVLWLDVSILPVVSLNQIFEEIERKGYFVLDNGWKIGPFMNPASARALGITMEEASLIFSCSAGLFGVDFSHKRARSVVEQWRQRAYDHVAFFSPRAEQNVLSVLLYQAGLREMTPIETMVEPNRPLSNHTLFMIDRGFVRL